MYTYYMFYCALNNNTLLVNRCYCKSIKSVKKSFGNFVIKKQTYNFNYKKS